MPDEFIGFIELDGQQCSFLLDERELRVFPSSKEQWEKDKGTGLKKFFDGLNKVEPPAWVAKKSLHGILYTGQRVTFHVQENPSWIEGFQSFDVLWLIVYERLKEPISEFSGMRMYSNDIDYYFPPSKAFQTVMTTDSATGRPSSFTTSSKIDTHKWGECQFSGYAATVDWSSSVTAQTGTAAPLTAKSFVRIDFLSPQSIETVWDCYFTFWRFLSYVTYRKNIMHFDVNLVTEMSDGKLYESAKIVVIASDPSLTEERHKKRQSRIMNASVLGENAKHLLPCLSRNEIYREHLCPSLDGVSQHNTARAIMIFAAFESEFYLLYGQDYQRSEDYLDVKRIVIDAIEDIRVDSTGDRKHYAKGFKRTIERMDSSLRDRICAAAQDCQEIMQPFVCDVYNTKNYNDISEAANRLNAIRNDVAHGNLGFKLEPINIWDYKILECLLYAMRLKRTVHLDSKNAQIAIHNLFGFNLGLDI